MLSYPVILLTLAALASFFGFQLLLPVVPLYAEQSGGGNTGAGLATAAFMFSTVLTQIQMPRAIHRFGYRPIFAAGLLLLGIPIFAYPFVHTLAPLLAVTLVRGVGFGIVTVLFSVLIVELAPAERRGEAMGLLGVAITLPTIFCNSLGLWLVEHSGYGVTFLLGGAATLVGFVFALGIRSVSAAGPGEKTGFFAGLRRGPLLRTFLLFSATTMTAGVIVTFLPIARPGPGIFSATGALLIIGAASTATRWWAGRFGDRRDVRKLILPSLAAGTLGMAALSWSTAGLLIGSLLFGAGLGAIENATLILMMSRVPKAEYGLASALWNAAFDSGTGFGALVFGLVIEGSNFDTAFYLCALLLAASAILVPLDRRRE